MKRLILFYLIGILSFPLYAQENDITFTFLNIPSSAHSAALGGSAIALIDDDPSLVFHTPTALASVTDKTLSLTFGSYMQGCINASAAFVKTLGSRSTIGVLGQFMSYGSQTYTDAWNTQSGTFSAKDIMIGGSYAYNLSDYLVGGVTGKFITSVYGDYSAIGLGVDLALNYYNEDQDLSLSAVAHNAGGQVKAFQDDYFKLPFNLELGYSQRLQHLPVRVHVTLTDLTRWKSSFYYSSDGQTIGTGRMLLNHLVVGMDILPTDYIFLSLGYNFRRSYELKAAGSNHGAGLCLGAGVNLKRFRVGASYAKYYVSTPTFMGNISYSF